MRMCTSTNIAGGQPHRSGRMRSSTNNTCSHPSCSNDGGGEDICIIGSAANKPQVDMFELGDLEVESVVQHEYGLTKRAAEVCFHSANIRPGRGLRGLEQVGEGKRLLLLCDDTHFRAVFIIWDKGFIFDSLGPRIGGMRGANQ